MDNLKIQTLRLLLCLHVKQTLIVFYFLLQLEYAVTKAVKENKYLK